MSRLQATIDRIGPLDEAARVATVEHLDQLTKPRGSLGRLEELAIQLAGITGELAPTFDRRAIVVATADHGVTAQGVSAYPSEVTAQMVANFVAGGAAINVLARMAHAEVLVVDVGVASADSVQASAPSQAGGRLLTRRIRPGTADLSVGPAMSRDEAIAAVDVGLDIARQLVGEGVRLVGLGEMGIGNTTAASSIVAALTGLPPSEVTGRGTGVDDATWRHKIAVIERGLDVNHPDPVDPVGVLAAVGGLEIALLTGLALGAAAEGIPVIADGFITGAAALVAARLCPALPLRLIAAHRSVEPGHTVVLDDLGLRPLLDLGLRLGEGTGAALAMTLVDAAVHIRDEMANFESAGVADRRS
jgi:nicotinate-nucleotide--dimethylbenzimidazole phosphoribosyltransferase